MNVKGLQQYVDDSILFWKGLDQQFDMEYQKRAQEAVAHVRFKDKVLGISTGALVYHAPLKSYVYLYRCYLKEEIRLQGLDAQLLLESFTILEEFNKNNPLAIGVLVVSQAEFIRGWNKAIWPGTEMMFIGNTPKGYPVRIRYFEGVKVLPVEQVSKES